MKVLRSSTRRYCILFRISSFEYSGRDDRPPPHCTYATRRVVHTNRTREMQTATAIIRAESIFAFGGNDATVNVFIVIRPPETGKSSVDRRRACPVYRTIYKHIVVYAKHALYSFIRVRYLF